MSKKQWGVLWITEDTEDIDDNVVCNTEWGVKAYTRPVSKKACKDFITMREELNPFGTYKLFKFKIKETI